MSGGKYLTGCFDRLGRCSYEEMYSAATGRTSRMALRIANRPRSAACVGAMQRELADSPARSVRAPADRTLGN